MTDVIKQNESELTNVEFEIYDRIKQNELELATIDFIKI